MKRLFQPSSLVVTPNFFSFQYFLVILIYWITPSTVFAQIDTSSQEKELFALSAKDIAKDLKLVETRLNKRTITASQLEQLASDAPATIYVITKDQIANRGYESLLDVLDDIPEVEIQRLANPEFNNHISLRGVAGNEKFIILLDGVRISAPTGDTHSIGMNFSVEQAEQVEVMIGPASALYGADAFSGIIQIITKKGRQQYANKLKSSYGSFNTNYNTIGLNAEIGDFSLNTNAMYYHSNGPNFPEIYPEEFNWFNTRYQPAGEVRITPFVEDLVTTTAIQGIDRRFEMPTNSYFVNVGLRYKDFEINYNRHGDDYTACGSTRPEFCVYSSQARFSYFVETLFARHTFRSRDLRWTLTSTFSGHTYQLRNHTAFVNTYTSYLPGYKMEFGKSRKIKEQLRFDISDKVNMVAGLNYEILDALPMTGDLPKQFDFSEPAPLQNQHYLGSDFVDRDRYSYFKKSNKKLSGHSSHNKKGTVFPAGVSP